MVSTKNKKQDINKLYYCLNTKNFQYMSIKIYSVLLTLLLYWLYIGERADPVARLKKNMYSIILFVPLQYVEGEAGFPEEC